MATQVNGCAVENPQFVVHEAWRGQITVQMNIEMAKLLSMFINEVDGDVEPAVKAIACALVNPGGRPFRPFVRAGSADYGPPPQYRPHRPV